MNTQQRMELLCSFNRHIDQKLKKLQKQKMNFEVFLQKTNQISTQQLPRIQIISNLSKCQQKIDNTINQTYGSICNVKQKLMRLKNRKQNTAHLLDILTSIDQIKKLSYNIKLQNSEDSQQTLKILSIFYQIKNKTKFCDKYIKQIQDEIIKIQQKYKRQFDNQLTKTNSNNIKDIAKVLQLIKTNKQHKSSQIIIDQHQKIQNKLNSNTSLIQISQFYVNMVKKQLSKYEQQLFNIPIIGNPNELSYIFFQIVKNALKTVVSLIQTYQNNIIKLQSLNGLHQVIVNIFKYIMQNLILQILIRQKKYYQIDKIIISRNKLTLKISQYKILKNYLKQFNAIWNQIERFRMHIYQYVDQNYQKRNQFKQQLLDIINTTKFIQFNYQIILYYQSFLRHQLDKILKKNPFVVSLWQFDEEFFKDVKNKNQYKSNLAGQDFIQQIITKFVDGVKKSFQTLNILIVSALINFVNSHLICQDSFYVFNQLLNRFLGKISQNKSIQGIILVFNTIISFPKAIKSSFTQIQIAQQLPIQRIKNEINQLIHNCRQKTQQFISDNFQKILNCQYIYNRIYQGKYQQISLMFNHLQKDLYELFIYKLSKHHVEVILSKQFKTSYIHMDVLDLQKQIRGIINFYQQKSHSIRQNFRKILIFIEVLLIENQAEFKKFAQQIHSKYNEEQLKNVWKLRTV